MKNYSYEEVYEKALEYFRDEISANVWVSKYAMKDSNGRYYELTPTDMHKRMAKEFANIEKNYSYDLTDELYNALSLEGQKYYREGLSDKKIFKLIDKFERIIPQGSVMSQLGHKFSIGSLSNCTVVDSPYDSYNGILNSDLELANLMKRRCGVGIDISTLRPDGAAVSNAAGSSTGAVSFMERFSNTTNEVSQNGRRGALMLSIDINHPNAHQFAIIKNDGIKVTGANVSIRLSDEFMSAVKNDQDFLHVWPITTNKKKYKLEDLQYNILTEKNGVYLKKVKAKSLWDVIIKSARDSAEPGLLFWDRQHKYSTSSFYPEYENISTNPCVVGDTLVLTNIGFIKIKNLDKYENLKIITQDKNGILSSSVLEWVGVTEKMDDIFEIEFSNGEKQRVNKKHKFYKADDFSELEVSNIKGGEDIIGYKSILTVTKLTDLKYKEDVYDLTANPNYNFFALYGYDETITTDNITITDDNEEINFKMFDVVETKNKGKIFAYELQEGDELL